MLGNGIKIDSRLLDNLKQVLAARNFKEYGDDYLEFEIYQAIQEINRCRKFTPKETGDLYDKKYEYLIIPMCVSALAKIGAEGQLSHSENGVARSYSSAGNYPKELTQQIIPLIKK